MKILLTLAVSICWVVAQPPYEGYSCPCKFEVIDNQPQCGCEDPCAFGPFCQYTYDSCACNNPCNPQQECTDVDGKPVCGCGNPCMTGEYCDVLIKSCACDNPCVSGECTDLGDGKMMCDDCADCFEGDYCDVPTVSCDCNNPCEEGEVCNLGEDGKPVCGCPDCFTGDRCDIPVASCECNNPCINPETCLDDFWNGVDAYCECDCIGNEVCVEQSDGALVCQCDDCHYNKYEGERGCEYERIDLCICNDPCTEDQQVCVNGADLDKQPVCKIGNPSSGNAFTVVFEENHTEKSFREIPLELYLTPAVPDSGSRFANLKSAGLASDHPCYFNVNRTIPENSVLRFEVDRCMMHNKTGLEKLAIQVVEMNNDTMIVYGINKDRWTADGFLAIPDAKTGKHFQTVSYAPAHISTQFAVVALLDDTEIEIELADDNNLPPPYHTKGAVYKQKMNAFETFQVQARCNTKSKSKKRNCKNDLTGSVIRSNKNVHVFSGNVRTFIETGKGLSRDHLVEEMIPVDRWGKEFGLVSVPGRVVGDLLNIMAVKGETTTVDLYSEKDGEFSRETFTLPTADGKVNVYKDLPSAHRYFVKSNKPLSVTQLTKSKDTYLHKNETYHDPSAVTVPPIEQFTNFFFISTPLFTGGENFALKPYHANYAMLVAKQGEERFIQLDGVDLSADEVDFVLPWAPLPGPGDLTGAVIVIPHGTSLLSNRNGKNFQCLIYGFDDRESYAFPAAMNLKTL